MTGRVVWSQALVSFFYLLPPYTFTTPRLLTVHTKYESLARRPSISVQNVFWGKHACSPNVKSCIQWYVDWSDYRANIDEAFFKLRGGLTHGGGMTESVRQQCVYTMPETVSLHLAMSALCGKQDPSSSHYTVLSCGRRSPARPQMFHWTASSYWAGKEYWS